MLFVQDSFYNKRGLDFCIFIIKWFRTIVWDEAWFLTLRVFGLLSSSLLLFSQSFGRYVLRPSSGEITIKMKTIIRKPLMIKIMKLHLKKPSINTWNVVKITIKMKTKVQKPLMLKIKLRRQLIHFCSIL